MLAVGCDRPATTALGDPTSVTEESGLIPHVPVIAAKKALAEGEVVFVDDGASVLATAVRKPTLAVVVDFVDEVKPIRYNKLHRLAYSGHAPRLGEAMPVDPEDLAELGFQAPFEGVWVFGPGGPCRATVGEPYVGRASTQQRTLEISYALTGCEAEAFAPVGSTALSVPPNLAWVPVDATADDRFAPSQGWDHPLAMFAGGPSAESPAHTFIAHARVVPGLQPTPAQALVTGLWGEPETCSAEVHALTTGLWDDAGFETFDVDWLVPEDPPLLVGALAQRGEPQALVFDDGLDALFAVMPAETIDPEGPQPVAPTDAELNPGPTTWTVRTAARGRWTELDRAAARFTVQPQCPASEGVQGLGE